MIHENLSTFYGMPVEDYQPSAGAAQVSRTAYRLRIDWEKYEEGITFADLFDQYICDQHVTNTQALVIGDWGGTAEGNESDAIVEALVSARDKLPNLKALFIGDLIGEGAGISWIMQSDMSPIWSAFPALEEFGVRGGSGLQLGRPSHANLKKLVIETGGLSVRVVQEVCSAQLPELTHLELWLGDPSYGADATVDDLRPLLEGGLFPKLTYLGLRNTELADDIARALPGAGVIQQIDTLDLSLGTLTNEGAEALAANQELSRLKKLDIHHHFVGPEAVAKLNGLGIEIDASDEQTADEYDGEIYRYVYASE